MIKTKNNLSKNMYNIFFIELKDNQVKFLLKMH